MKSPEFIVAVSSKEAKEGTVCPILEKAETNKIRVSKNLFMMFSVRMQHSSSLHKNCPNIIATNVLPALRRQGVAAVSAELITNAKLLTNR